MGFFEAMAAFYHVKSCIKISIVNVQNAFCGDSRLMSLGTHACMIHSIIIIETNVGLRTPLVEPVSICWPNGRARSALPTIKGFNNARSVNSQPVGSSKLPRTRTFE